MNLNPLCLPADVDHFIQDLRQKGVFVLFDGLDEALGVIVEPITVISGAWLGDHFQECSYHRLVFLQETLFMLQQLKQILKASSLSKPIYQFDIVRRL